MCTGPTHLAVGVAGGAAVALASHWGAADVAAAAVYGGTFATLPDIDQRGSCCSRGLGPLSALVAVGAHKITGGHRHFTHTLIGAATIAWLAQAGGHWRHDWYARWPLALLLALAFAGAVYALPDRVWGRGHRSRRHLGDAAAIAAAAGIAVTGWGLPLLPAGAFTGVMAHIFADACTDEGVPLFWVPLFWDGHVKLLPEPLSFTTGTKPEQAFKALALAAVAWLTVVTTARGLGHPFPLVPPLLHIVHGHLAMHV